jgi:hypothetical protein
MANSPNVKKNAAITKAAGASPRLGLVACTTKSTNLITVVSRAIALNCRTPHSCCPTPYAHRTNSNSHISTQRPRETVNKGTRAADTNEPSWDELI